MTRTGQTVSLKVAKQGAIYHGLAKLLSQPSPILQQRGELWPEQDNNQKMAEQGAKWERTLDCY